MQEGSRLLAHQNQRLKYELIILAGLCCLSSMVHILSLVTSQKSLPTEVKFHIELPWFRGMLVQPRVDLGIFYSKVRFAPLLFGKKLRQQIFQDLLWSLILVDACQLNDYTNLHDYQSSWSRSFSDLG